MDSFDGLKRMVRSIILVLLPAKLKINTYRGFSWKQMLFESF